MAVIGSLRRRGQRLVRLDRFGYAYVFALMMELVRYRWAGREAGSRYLNER